MVEIKADKKNVWKKPDKTDILNDHRCSELLSILARRGDGRETVSCLLRNIAAGNVSDDEESTKAKENPVSSKDSNSSEKKPESGEKDQDKSSAKESSSLKEEEKGKTSSAQPQSPETTADGVTASAESKKPKKPLMNDDELSDLIIMLEESSGKETVGEMIKKVIHKDDDSQNDDRSASSSLSSHSIGGNNKASSSSSTSSSQVKEGAMRAIMTTASKSFSTSNASKKKKISPEAVYKLAFQITNSVVDRVKMDRKEGKISITSSLTASTRSLSPLSNDGNENQSLGSSSSKGRTMHAKKKRRLTATHASQRARRVSNEDTLRMRKGYKTSNNSNGFELSDTIIGNIDFHSNNMMESQKYLEQKQNPGKSQQLLRQHPHDSHQKQQMLSNGMLSNILMEPINHHSMSHQMPSQQQQQHLQGNNSNNMQAVPPNIYMDQEQEMIERQRQQAKMALNATSFSTASSENSSNGSNSESKEIFPMILHRLLLELDGVEGGGDIAMFVPNGSAFCIVDTMAFEDSVMSMYFPRLKNFSSFLLQLNIYEFERLDSPLLPKGKCAYFHPLFHRDNPNSISQMRPRKRKRNSV